MPPGDTMRRLFLAAIALAVLVLGCGPGIPSQADTLDWFVGVMSQTGTILRKCVPHDEWHTTERTEAERQQALADLEVIQRMGKAAVDQGVDVHVNDLGEYVLNFREEMSADAWRAIWPEVEAYKVVAERNLADLQEKAREVGCA